MSRLNEQQSLEAVSSGGSTAANEREDSRYLPGMSV
jgi:hypothetical protein